jgi:hypothetical protein
LTGLVATIGLYAILLALGALVKAVQSRPRVFKNGAYLTNCTFRHGAKFLADRVFLSGCKLEGNLFVESPNFSLTNSVVQTASPPAISIAPGKYSGAISGISIQGGNPAPALAVETSIPDEVALTFGTEPLVAYRAWGRVDFVARDGTTEPRLAPIGVTPAASVLWYPRQRMEAVCLHHAHAAPDIACTCGVWALPTIDKARAIGAVSMFGEVYLWGRVIEFEQGYRAQYAYPKALFLFGNGRSPAEELSRLLTADELSRLYGVPVDVVPLEQSA